MSGIKRTIYKAWLFAAVLTIAYISGHSQEDEYYFPLSEMPDAGVFLPQPPEFEDAIFADDMLQWQWGVSVRDSERGEMASQDSKFGAERMAEIYGNAIGLQITPESTPAIWRLLYRTGKTCRLSVTNAKNKYMRKRPFAKLNSYTFGTYDDKASLQDNGSYPSGHTAFGWSTALALAEMAPEYQDTLLRRGFEYGENRVIVGAHWQSDVDAAFLAMAAAIARLHSSNDYAQDLAAAREEFARLKGLDKATKITEFPDLIRILGMPCDSASHRFYGDMVQYWLAEHERPSERGMQAVSDADLSDSALLKGFSPSFGTNLSPTATPRIAAAISAIKQEMLRETEKTQAELCRKSPVRQFGEDPLIPDDTLADRYSYPSSQAAVGWGVALVLTEIAPERQNEIMSRGYEYGRSSVITGSNYASDVQAGRIMASYIYTLMHNTPEFRQLITQARNEYARIRR